MKKYLVILIIYLVCMFIYFAFMLGHHIGQQTVETRKLESMRNKLTRLEDSIQQIHTQYLLVEQVLPIVMNRYDPKTKKNSKEIYLAITKTHLINYKLRTGNLDTSTLLLNDTTAILESKDHPFFKTEENKQTQVEGIFEIHLPYASHFYPFSEKKYRWWETCE